MTARYTCLLLALSGLGVRCPAMDAGPAKSNDWHITAEAYSNAPYWLMPTNLPYRLTPLKNGRWVWTTNRHSILNDEVSEALGVRDVGVDNEKRLQVEREQRKRMDKTVPTGVAHVIEYSRRGWDQRYLWETNMLKNWTGVWSEDTNTGWRVQLIQWRMPTATAQEALVSVLVGSIVTNSGPGLLTTPDGKYARLELTDSNGKAVPARRGAALKLYQNGLTMYDTLPPFEKWSLNAHPPSAGDPSVTRIYPDAISDLEYVRAKKEYSPWGNSTFVTFAGFLSNGPPCTINWFKFNDIFAIKSEGDYTLTVQPVLYRMHYEGGTFQGYLDRVDLPSVTAKYHLAPNAK